jgi:hypothetical protein
MNHKDSLAPFKIFLKLLGDIRKSRGTTGINDTGGKFATVFASKFATGVKDTSGKIATGVVATGGIKGTDEHLNKKSDNV